MPQLVTRTVIETSALARTGEDLIQSSSGEGLPAALPFEHDEDALGVAPRRAFEIEVTVPNPDHRLNPGSFATARVMTRVERDVVFVPRDAVVTFAGVNKVFTVKDGKAVEVVVELGQRQADRVEVAKGLNANDPVVTAGAAKLSTGVPVQVQTAGAAPATAPAEASARAAPAE